MSFETIIFDKEDYIGRITLNRPDRFNALNDKMYDELIEVLDEIDDDEDVRVLIITGAGKAFCAGADVTGDEDSETIIDGGSVKHVQHYLRTGCQKVTRLIQGIPQPTISMVNGVAVGGGFEIACACDIRIGSEKARFMNAFIKIGLFPDMGGTWLIPRIVGINRALEILYTGDPVDAETAEKIGLLNKMAKAEDLEKETMKMAAKIAAGPPLGMALTKMQVYKGQSMDWDSALEVEAACMTTLINSEDYKNAIQAFRDNKKPTFSGR